MLTICHLEILFRNASSIINPHSVTKGVYLLEMHRFRITHLTTALVLQNEEFMVCNFHLTGGILVLNLSLVYRFYVSSTEGLS